MLYQILQNESLKELQLMISEAGTQGWRIYGDLIISPRRFDRIAQGFRVLNSYTILIQQEEKD